MSRRQKTPTILQMEATECGAASLGMVLAHYGRFETLERLREECGVSRDGSKASNLIKAGQRYGLIAKGFSKTPEALRTLKMPVIIHWNFNHFLVLEGFGRDCAFLNDPATGRRRITDEELDQAFTGVVLTFEPGPEWKPGGSRPKIVESIKARTQGVRSIILFLLITSAALVIPGLALPTISRVFVDDVLIQNKNDWLRPLIVGLLFTALVRAALVAIKQRYLLRAFTKLAVSGSARFVWHVLKLPIPFFLARFPGEIGDRIHLNDKVASVLSGRLADAGLDLLMVAFYGVLLLIYDPTLTAIVVGISAINLVVLRHLSGRLVDENRRVQQEAGKLVGVSMGGLQVIETFKAGGSESDFFQRWAGYYAKVHNAAGDLATSMLYLQSVPTLLTSLSSATILVMGGMRIMDGAMTVGGLVAFQTLMASFLAPVHSLVSLGGELQEAEADLMRLDDVLGHPEAPSSNAPPDGAPGKLEGWLELSGVTFGYVRHSPALVTNLDLLVAPGSRVALVGGSGSGKSTIARLVAGLYEPWEGTIRLDQKTRAELPEEILQSSVAMVDQDISMFEGTIRENLTLWDPSIPEADIIQAAKDAHIHEEIAARPGGYDSKVEEAGRNFSGGQRQRLEIARALVRNPTVLLLDEATSALDPKTEEIIDQNLRRRGCTCLIVAHRLSTIRDADEIIVLENGSVAERGTHRSLMEAKGPYAQLMGAA